MKRIIAVGVLIALAATSMQAQAGAGSDGSGPGGSGGGATAGVGAFLPTSGGSPVGGFSLSTGMPTSGVGSGFSNPTGPANVSIGGVTVSVSPAAQQAAAGAVTGNNVAGFTASLGGAVPGPAAAALGGALANLGSAARGALIPTFVAALSNAITAFNAAVNAMAPGAPLPPSLVAARALIAGYYQ